MKKLELSRLELNNARMAVILFNERKDCLIDEINGLLKTWAEVTSDCKQEFVVVIIRDYFERLQLETRPDLMRVTTDKINCGPVTLQKISMQELEQIRDKIIEAFHCLPDVLGKNRTEFSVST